MVPVKYPSAIIFSKILLCKDLTERFALFNAWINWSALRIGKRSDFKTNDWDDLITIITALVTLVTELKADLDANNNLYDAHTHECPGSSFVASRCSTPDTGAAENSLTASAASALTADVTAATPDTPVLNN